MIFSQCKCGNLKSWSSGCETPCAWCTKCDSDLATGPDLHRDRVPHEFEAHKVDTDEGPKTLSRCRWCMRTKAQIQRANE